MKLTKENVIAALDIYAESASELLSGTICITGGEIEEIAEYYGTSAEKILRDNPGIKLTPCSALCERF